MLAQMLSSTPSARPNAAAFSGCQWFQEDMLLRCLKFLDTILQRDTGQKVRSSWSNLVIYSCMYKCMLVCIHMCV